MSFKLFRKWFLVILVFVVMIPLTVQAKGGPDKVYNVSSENSNRPDQDYQVDPIQFENASVHDPSIIKVEDTFYVIGSHIDGAKSDDLINWTNYTNGYTTPGNTIYGDLSKNLAGSFEWAGENDADSRNGFAVWAPEIIWNEHYEHEDGTTGAYMMYYSASSTYIRSAIGYAVSKDIEGPFEYVDTIMYSGFFNRDAYDNNSRVNKHWKNTNIADLIEEGVIEDVNPEWFTSNGGYNYRLYTNSIDANLFFDEEGKLWMTYGSWAGGIYILEVDPATGQPMYPGEDGVTEDGRMIDRYFGTKIAGGYGYSVEGPYALYDQETDYYYLYVTYGGLSASGGYQMRVYRSENPDGPYVDASGATAVFPDSLDDGTVRNKVNNYAHAEYGNKLMGNFLFERKVGDPGTGDGYGYLSPGHNSVYTDPDTGERFLVFHTRFPERGEMHEVRVHQMFMNKDGWPVVAPYRYTGEKLAKVNRQDLIGEYSFINHGKDVTSSIEKSVYLSLNKDNTISGDVSGTWKKTSHNQAELVINGEIFEGVFVRQYDPTSELVVMTFTAMSSDGIMVWGSKLQDRTDEEIIADVANDLNLGDVENVISNLTLPTEGTRYTEIMWESSDPSVVTNTGVVTRPAVGEENAVATLTATITKSGKTATQSYEITVLAYSEAGLVAHYSFNDHLKDEIGNFGDGVFTGDRINNTGGTINYVEGLFGNAAKFDGNSGVKLPNGLISSNTYSVSLWLKPEQLTNFTTTFFGARDGNNWMSLVPQGPVGNQTMVWSGSSRWYDAPIGSTVPTNEWSHLVITVDEGTIKVYVNGVERFSGNNYPNIFTNTQSQFSLGVNWWDTPYKGLMDELRIYEGALTPNYILDLAKRD
ncbi:LamG-like jellyroll fold domain-containing protein [Halalkalibacter akibai]|uniref:Maltodextrin glucosidase n=1 Tax=Halalkalibacter akibai (strain ATCC 43226 / DSM 21942 / CIP 109018 / JCM 9157 / 1139) TaxID=1236973 RepID=W4QYE3_HALA3|nr:LamG-like jellyroll fold domain-containing protein [Halalkalibacter akibai]GAE37106.1 maltodextrin glucosidase [Halalkalibacter akibai JCM 9157]